MSNSAGESCQQPMRARDGRRILVDRSSPTGRTLLGAKKLLAFIPAMVMLMAAIPLIQYSSYQAKLAAYYEKVVQNLSEPIVVVNDDGIILLSNIAAHQLFGCEELSDCLEGKSIYDFVQSDQQQRTLMDMRSENGQFPDQNLAVTLKKHHDGSVFDANVGIRQLVGMDGRPAYVAVVIPQDIDDMALLAPAPVFKVEKAPPPPAPAPEVASSSRSEGFTLEPNDAQRAAKESYRRAPPTRSFIPPNQYRQWQQKQQQQQQQWTP